MQHVACKCGVQYRVPEKLAGRSARCKHCGAVIQIPVVAQNQYSSAPTPNSAARAELSDRREPRETSRDSGHRNNRMDPGDLTSESDLIGSSTGVSAYLKDCLFRFVFISEPGNLSTFLGVAAMAAFLPLCRFGFIFGAVATFVIQGWICAFLFNTVVESAGGEKSLPQMSTGDGFVEGILMPLIRFFAAIAVASLPAIVCIALAGKDGTMLWQERNPVFVACIGLGTFLWPMLVLVVAVGGTAGLLRMDLILVTLFRTFGPYLVTLACTAVALSSFAIAQFSVLTPSATAPGHPLALAMMLQVLQLYVWTVVMQVIGLYYHYFKNRFAWTWD